MRLFAKGYTSLLAAGCILAALIMGLAIAFFPLGFLDGEASFWQRPMNDAAEHIIGGRYFIADTWRFPLLFVPALGVPAGTNIGLTDSIPIAAMIAKLLRGALDPQRPYLPLWIFLCYLMQGPAAALALFALGIRGVIPLVLGGLLLVFTPIWLFRFGHAALCAHFLLLLGLAVHFHYLRGTGGRKGLVLLNLPLLILALLVHIYLFAMIFALMLATLLHGLWTERLMLRTALVQLGACLVTIIAVMWVCGYFALGPIPMKPYGEAALDLAAPFSPGPSGVFGMSALPDGRSYEGFAWFGAGTAALIIMAAVIWRRQLPSLIARYFPTIAISAALVVFALSYGVRAGPIFVLGVKPEIVRRAVLEGPHTGGVAHVLTHLLTSLDALRIVAYLALLLILAAFVVVFAWRRRRLPFLIFVSGAAACIVITAMLRPSAVALVISNFQASGRFVWVPVYLISLLAIASVCQFFRPATAIAILCGALVLQVADTVPFWRLLLQDAAYDAKPTPDEGLIAAAAVQAQSVTLVPTYLCAYAEPLDAPARNALIAQIVDVQAVVSRWVRPINSVRNSRMTATDTAALSNACDAERNDARERLSVPGTMTLVLGAAPAEEKLREKALTLSACRPVVTGVLCAGQSSAQEH